VRTPAKPVEVNSLGFALEVGLIVDSKERRFAISDVKPVAGDQREVVLREQP
jgi:hypothetical protein